MLLVDVDSELMGVDCSTSVLKTMLLAALVDKETSLELSNEVRVCVVIMAGKGVVVDLAVSTEVTVVMPPAGVDINPELLEVELDDTLVQTPDTESPASSPEAVLPAVVAVVIPGAKVDVTLDSSVDLIQVPVETFLILWLRSSATSSHTPSPDTANPTGS